MSNSRKSTGHPDLTELDDMLKKANNDYTSAYNNLTSMKGMLDQMSMFVNGKLSEQRANPTTQKLLDNNKSQHNTDSDSSPKSINNKQTR